MSLLHRSEAEKNSPLGHDKNGVGVVDAELKWTVAGFSGVGVVGTDNVALFVLVAALGEHAASGREVEGVLDLVSGVERVVWEDC